MYTRIEYPKIMCLDSNGYPAAGYKIYTYAAGTSTPAATYSDRSLSVPNTNPVVLNSRGEADIYVGVAVKLVFTTPTGDPGSPIWTVDYVGEQQSTFVSGAATGGTSHNKYVVDVVPAVSALSNNLMLVMTPDIDNVDTLTSTVFTGTGINDLTASGPYVGTVAGSVFTVQIDGTGEPAPGAPTAVLSGDAGVVTAGNHTVKITFITHVGETLPGTASGAVAADGTHAIDLTGIPTGSSQVTARKVYMTKAGGSVYYYVGVINDNVTTVYQINVADAGLTVLAPTADTTDDVNTFKWKKDGGAWTAQVAMTGSLQTLIEGVGVTFAVTAGHTLSDLWAITVETPARVNLCSLSNPDGLVVYKNKGGSIVALDGGDMKAGYPAQLILNQALNGWVLTNPATPVFSTPTITAIRYRKIITANYSLVADDQGYELSCSGTLVVSLLACTQFSNRFCYISNVGTGLVTVDAAGTELIYGLNTVAGLGSFLLTPGMSVQMQTNGVDWHVLTTSVVVPTGTITAFGGATAPYGYMMCDGTAISRTTYAALFAVTGTAFGVGDGATTFNLPDLRERFPLGKAAAGGYATLGATGGSIYHTHPLGGSAGVAAAGADITVPNVANGADPAYQIVNFIIKY